MAHTLHVRDIDDDIILRLEHRALRNGRSLESEHREVLAAEPEQTFDALAAELRALTA